MGIFPSIFLFILLELGMGLNGSNRLRHYLKMEREVFLNKILLNSVRLQAGLYMIRVRNRKNYFEIAAFFNFE